MAREMKDSGIQWIGEIPKEWGRCKIKNICLFIGSGTTPASNNKEFYEFGTINWIQSGDIYGKSITDPCLGWDKTERLIYEMAELL